MGWFSFGNSTPAVITVTEIQKDLEAVRTSGVALADSLIKALNPLGFLGAVRIAHKTEALTAAFETTTKHLKELQTPPNETEARDLVDRFAEVYKPFEEGIAAILKMKGQFDRLKISFVVEHKIKLLNDVEVECYRVFDEVISSPTIIEKLKARHESVKPGTQAALKEYAGSPEGKPEDIPVDSEEDRKAIATL